MSRFPFALPAFTLATLLAFDSAFAQQTIIHPNSQIQSQPPTNQPGQPVRTQSGQPGITQPGQPGITQPGQPVTTQSGAPSTGRPRANPSGQSDQYQSRRVPQESNAQRMTVKDALVQKLRMANEAEIELAQMAESKADDDELRQFAKMLVKDHQMMNQKLDSLGQQGRNSIGNQPGNQAARQAGRNQGGNQGDAQMVSVPPQLTRVMDKAHQNALTMTKEMLQREEGKDFRMAFLGQQCLAHTMQLAALKAIESDGPQELQPVAQEVITTVESHLDRAKELAQKFKDKKNQNN